MTALAANASHPWAVDSDIADPRKGVSASTEVFVGSILEQDGLTVKPYDGTGTSGFAGVSLDYADNSAGAAGAKTIRARERGTIETSINSTVTAGDEGTSVYAATDNPTDITKTSTDNLPVGKIRRVITAGSAGANLVQIKLEADGQRSI